MKTSRHWLITLNNPPEYDNFGPFEGEMYCVYQLEQGSSGTPHIQAVVGFKTNLNLGSVKKTVGREAHAEPCIDVAKSIMYCCKEKSRHPNFGVPRVRGILPDIDRMVCATRDPNLIKLLVDSRGSVNNQETVNTPISQVTTNRLAEMGRLKKLVIEGRELYEIYELEYEIAHRHDRYLKALIKSKASGGLESTLKNEVRPLPLTLLTGDPGAGKSTFVQFFCGFFKLKCYVKPDNEKWFDGYNSQEVICFEEYQDRPGTIPVINSLADGTHSKVQIKGSYRSVDKLEHIFVCTNKDSKEVFDAKGPTVKVAAWRRVTTCIVFKRVGPKFYARLEMKIGSEDNAISIYSANLFYEANGARKAVVDLLYLYIVGRVGPEKAYEYGKSIKEFAASKGINWAESVEVSSETSSDYFVRSLSDFQ